MGHLLLRKINKWLSIVLVMTVVFTLIPIGYGKSAATTPTHVVISEVYGGGGNSGAEYKNDFIELYNPTDQEISLEGWSVQYASKTGTSWNKVDLRESIKPYSYYLIQLAAGSGGTKTLPQPDVLGTINMSGTAGKVALASKTEAIKGINDQQVVDFVGFGSDTNEFEGTGSTPAPSNTTSVERKANDGTDPTSEGEGKGNGWDTNDNTTDFVTSAPNPQNSQSPAEAIGNPDIPVVTVSPKGNTIQFNNTDSSNAQITGQSSSVNPGAEVKLYLENPTEVIDVLPAATITADTNGTFTISFDNSTTNATTIFLTSTEEGREESLPVQINEATKSEQPNTDLVIYDLSNKEVVGIVGSVQSSSTVYIYDQATDGQPLANIEGESFVIADSQGKFSFTIAGEAPQEVYVSQIAADDHGINFESDLVKIQALSKVQISSLKETDENGSALKIGQIAIVEGIATVAQGVLSSKTDFYIQDETAGINVFNYYDLNLPVNQGDLVRVKGTVTQYRGLLEIEITSADDVEIISSNQTLPQPMDISIENMNVFSIVEPLEGSLVKVEGKLTAIGTNSTLIDENGKTTTIRVANNQASWDGFEVNSYVRVTGILSQYDSSSPYTTGYQVFPRSQNDIEVIPHIDITHEPLVSVYQDTDVTFTANILGAEKVYLHYREIGGADYQRLDVFGDDQNNYSITIPAVDVPQTGFEYYIEAIAGEGELIVTSGNATSPYAVSVVPDTEGPLFYGELPVHGIKVENLRPAISVMMDDPSGIQSESIAVLLDGKSVTNIELTNNELLVTLTQDLLLGNHTVKVQAQDNKGNQSEYTWTFEVVDKFEGGFHYRGTTHNHTKFSHDGSGEPEDALNEANEHQYDWFAFSDHSHDIDAELVDQDTVDRDGMPERTGGEEWRITKELAQQYTVDGKFVVFPAFEMTSTKWGHSNVFGTENFIDRKMNNGMYQDLMKYYAWVLTYDDVAAQFNHPSWPEGAFNNFAPYDSELDKLFTMLEVGNGSGHYTYYNAEDQFFSALDLGWHIAPTFGEDNHDSTWGQTMRRTVIVSDQLTNESLIHSMRNLRVYMTEDPNFQLDVTANGYYMGATIDSTDLKFHIEGKDLVTEANSNPDYHYLPASYQSDDRIQKVELITNGATVEASIEPMTTDFTWEPEVSVTGQQWFVVKVTQMDGEQMYSAPIWSKEVPYDVKISGLGVEGDTIIAGIPATLQAGVSNLGSNDISNLTVKFYYDQEDEAHFIGEKVIQAIASKGVATASATWDSPVGGEHILIAVINGPEGDATIDNRFEKAVHIKEPLGITVMIDASHGNENTTTDPGYYKDNFKKFTTLLQREGYTVIENKTPLSLEVLNDADILMITHPATDLTEEENQIVKEYVNNGGSLLVIDKSNYKNDPTVSNDLLQTIGSTIQINHDGIFDDSVEGNFWSDPLKAKHAVRLYPDLVDNYINDRVSFVDYYSGASLFKTGNEALSDSDTVTVLAWGNETTYQSVTNSYYVYDTVSDEQGGSSIPAIAVEELENSRLFVSGMNIFNDKQLDEGFELKGNDEFALNVINWLAYRDTVVKSLEETRALEDGTFVVVEGVVTSAAGTFFDAFYIQDETGGIMAYNEVPDDSLQLGDKVRIYGHLKTFENNRELEFEDFNLDVIKIGQTEPIEPKQLTTGKASLDENQGLLVKVKGKVKSQYDENSYVINDGSGDILIFTDGYIVNQTGAVPVLQVGDTLSAVGLTGKFAEGYRIRVRDTRELEKVNDNNSGNDNNNDDRQDEPQENPNQPMKVEVELTALLSQLNDKNKAKVVLELKQDQIKNGQPIEINFNQQALEQILKSGKPIVIQSEQAQVELPKELLEKVKTNKEFKVTIKLRETSGSVQIATIKQANAVSAILDLEIGGWDGTEPVTITFNYDNKKVADWLKLGVYQEVNGKWQFVGGDIDHEQYQLIAELHENGSYVVIHNETTFADIQNHWAKNSIERATAQQIIKGRSLDQFAPEEGLTRAEFASMLVRLFQLKGQNNVVLPFTDVNDNDWYAEELSIAYENGLIKGNSNNEFNPNQLLSRQDMVVMLGRVLEKEGIELTKAVELKDFRDEQQISDYAKSYVEMAVQASLINGLTEDQFGPNKGSKRAEAAVILIRLLEQL